MTWRRPDKNPSFVGRGLDLQKCSRHDLTWDVLGNLPQDLSIRKTVVLGVFGYF